jgi:hypothetical protein
MESFDARTVRIGAKGDAFGANSYSSRTPTVGRIAAIVAVAGALLEVAAIVVGNDRLWLIATWLAYGVIGLTGLAFLGGLAAVILRRGGGWGVCAMVVGVFANPLVQIAVFGMFGNS